MENQIARPKLLLKASECEVARIRDDLFLVKSPSGKAYWVRREKEAYKCECEGFKHVGRCSHWLSVMMSL